MKRIVSTLLIVLFVLTLLSPVSAGTSSSVQLTPDEMVQITGGKIACGGYGDFYCCCLSIWVFDICFCVG
jgi:hypothetical protein